MFMSTSIMSIAPVVTLSGEDTVGGDLSDPRDGRAGIRVNDDGTIEEYSYNGASATITQVDAATDWIIPNSAASSDYEFRLDVTTNAPNYSSDSTATWIAMGSGNNANYLQWIRQYTGASTENYTWTLRVRRNGGAEIDSASYTGSIINI